MLTSTDATWDALLGTLSGADGGLIVCELTLLDGTILRYAPIDGVSYGGNAYTKLLVEGADTEESIEFDVDEAVVRFSNVNRDLATYIAPSDRLTGATLTLRVIFGDGAGGWLADSLEYFEGLVEPVDEIDELIVELRAVHPLGFNEQRVPRRRINVGCPWQFGDAVRCNYVSTTTASGAGAASTSLTVADATNLVEGELISIGGGAAVEITNIAGAVVTLAEARTWADTDAVSYTECNRQFGNCQKREREQDYGGFLGRAAQSRSLYRFQGFPNSFPGALE